MTLVLVVLLGFAAGVLSGMFGVGGGILFVPTLSLVVGLTHLEAQATSLAAVIPSSPLAPGASIATATSAGGRRSGSG